MAPTRVSSWKKWIAPIFLGVALVLTAVFVGQPFGPVKKAEAAPFEATTSTTWVENVSLTLNAPRAFLLDSTGTRIIILDSAVTPSLNEYSLPIAFQITSTSTPAFITQTNISSIDSSPRGLATNSTGSRMFVLGATNKRVNTFALSDAYNIAPTSTTFLYWYDVSAQNPSPRGMTFNNDGTKMFVTSLTEGRVSTYNLSIPYVVSTSSVSFDHYTSVLTQTAQASDLKFSADGTKLLIIDFTVGRVVTYNLSTPFEVSTSSLSFDHYYSVNTSTTAPGGLFFNPDGTKLWIDSSTGNFISTYTNLGSIISTAKAKKQSEFFFD